MSQQLSPYPRKGLLQIFKRTKDEKCEPPCFPWTIHRPIQSVKECAREVSMHQMAYHFNLLHFWEQIQAEHV